MAMNPNHPSALASYLADRRALTSRRVASVLEPFGERLSAIGPEGARFADVLRDFTLPGKMLRAALVYLGRDLFSDAPSDDAVASVACAMELFQTGLLVHDDIMDRDDTRRGGKTVHREFMDEAAASGSRDAAHEGLSVGICAGDAAFFEGFATLAAADADPGALRDIAALAGRELADVAFAQTRDVRWGRADSSPTEDEVLRMYAHKTARYTLSLPLAAGALLAGRPDAVAPLLAFGEAAGVAFQIRDDELGLYGAEDKLGKPVGSDLREGKMTIYRVALEAVAPTSDRARLASIYGSETITPADLSFVRELTERLGVRERVGLVADGFAAKALCAARALDAPRAEPKALLESLVAWLTKREA